MSLTCDAVVRVGAVTADGGAATAATGGLGGLISLFSGGGQSARTGVLSVRGGVGTTPAADGEVTVDGATQPPTGGQLRP